MGPKATHRFSRIERFGHLQTALVRFGMESDPFLETIITGDEIWIHYYKPESKHQSMRWKHPHSTVKKKFKTHPTAGKVTLGVFWESQGLLLERYQERASTVTSARYSEMLCDKRKPTIRSKRRGLLSKGVVLLHDTAVLTLLSTLLNL
jgi:hypothetical protein